MSEPRDIILNALDPTERKPHIRERRWGETADDILNALWKNGYRIQRTVADRQRVLDALNQWEHEPVVEDGPPYPETNRGNALVKTLRAALGDTPPNPTIEMLKQLVNITGDGSVQSNVDSAVEPPQPEEPT